MIIIKYLFNVTIKELVLQKPFLVLKVKAHFFRLRLTFIAFDSLIEIIKR